MSVKTISMSGLGKENNVWVGSSLLGLAAGLGAVLLPGKMGLKEKYSNRKLSTQLMTVGLYVAGSLVTTAVVRMAQKRKQKKQNVWEQRLVTSAMG